MNFSRQMELYDAENTKDLVSVIGLGATGSWVSLILSKLGVNTINIIDMDIIETHNIPNQVYGLEDNGKLKTKMCLKHMCELGSGVSNIIPMTEAVTPEDIRNDTLVTPTVFCLVDSMKDRKELFEEALKSKYIKVWIETRMGLTGYRIYLIHLDNQKEIDKYRETLYSDDDAEVSACGASQSVVTTAMQCASHAVGLWLAEKNDAEYVPNEIICDVHSSFMMSRKFDKKEEESKDGNE